MSARSPDRLLHAQTTRRVIGVFFHVYNEMGPGFAERTYSRAMYRELTRLGATVRAEAPLTMRYGTALHLRFRADLLVDGCVLVEVKARSRILKGHWAQLLHYMQMAGIEVGLVLNFGRWAEFKRLVLTGQPRIDH